MAVSTTAIILSVFFLLFLCNCIVALPMIIQLLVTFYTIATAAIAYGAQVGRFIGVHLLSAILHVLLLPVLLVISLLGGFFVGFLRRLFRLTHAVAWSLCGTFLKKYISIPPTNGLGGPIICARAASLPSPPIFIGHDFYFSLVCCCNDPFSNNVDKQFGGLCSCCDEHRCKNRFRGTDYDYEKSGMYKCSCLWKPLQSCWIVLCALITLLWFYTLGSGIAQLGVPCLIGFFIVTILLHIPVGFLAVLVSFPYYTAPLYTTLPIAFERAGSLAGSGVANTLGWLFYVICCFTLECRQLGNKKRGGSTGLCLQLLKGGITSTLPSEVYLNQINNEITMGRPKEGLGPISEDFLSREHPIAQTQKEIKEEKIIVSSNPLKVSIDEEPVIIAVDQDQVGVWQLYKKTGLITHVENFSTPSANSQPFKLEPILPLPPGGCGLDCNAALHTGLCLRCEKDWNSHNRTHVCANGTRGSWLLNTENTTPSSTSSSSSSSRKLHWLPEHFRSNHGKNEYEVTCVGEIKDTRLPKWVRQLEIDALSERNIIESQPLINSSYLEQSVFSSDKARLERTLLALKEKEKLEEDTKIKISSSPQQVISIASGLNDNTVGSQNNNISTVSESDFPQESTLDIISESNNSESNNNA